MCLAASSTSITRSQHDESGFPRPTPDRSSPAPPPRAARRRLLHYDGYPAHQGRILFDAVTGHFAGDPDAACSYLIDQHPAGWSVLGGDFTVPPGFRGRP